MSQLRIPLVITFLSTNGATAVNFLVGLVLARLLSPSDIGIFSITSVLVTIAHIFRDFGVTSYLLREKDLTPEKIRSAFGVLLVTSWTIACALYLLSQPVANYFNEQGIASVMPVLALGFVFIPFGSITNSLLTRDLRARDQATINIFGTTAYAGSSIIFALLGFGYMSLAWANLVNIVVTSLACIPFRPAYAPWMPSLSGWRAITNFGMGALLSNTLNSINNALSDIFLGKMSNAHDVGIYSRANGTAMIFMQVAGPTVNYAALTHLAKSFHASGNITPQLSKANAFLSVLAWPVLGVTALYSSDVILLLYGIQWLECAPLIPFTCAIVACSLSVHFLGPSLIAIGRPYLAILPSLVALTTRLGFLFTIYDGTLISFALGMLYGSLAAIPAYLWIQGKYLKFSMYNYFSSQTNSLLVAAATTLTAWIMSGITPDSLAPVLRLLAVAPPCILIWYIALRATRHPLTEELHMLLPSRIRGMLKT